MWLFGGDKKEDEDDLEVPDTLEVDEDEEDEKEEDLSDEDDDDEK
jgi:hypothetical protein